MDAQQVSAHRCAIHLFNHFGKKNPDFRDRVFSVFLKVLHPKCMYKLFIQCINFFATPFVKENLVPMPDFIILVF